MTPRIPHLVSGPVLKFARPTSASTWGDQRPDQSSETPRVAATLQHMSIVTAEAHDIERNLVILDLLSLTMANKYVFLRTG
jgi:hypothetical protein